MIIKIPVKIASELKMSNMLEFLSPEYLKISISLFSKNLIKKAVLRLEV